MHQGAVDVSLREEPFAQRIEGFLLVLASAVGIDAGLQGHGRRLGRGRLHLVAGTDVADCTAVARHIAVEPVDLPHHRVDEVLAPGDRMAVDPVVAGHDARQLLLFDQVPVLRDVEFAEVAGVHVRGAHVAVELAVVGEEVLARGDRFQIGRVGTHHAADETARDSGDEERIFTV